MVMLAMPVKLEAKVNDTSLFEFGSLKVPALEGFTERTTVAETEDAMMSVAINPRCFMSEFSLLFFQVP